MNGIVAFLAGAKESAPDPDGLPFSAWRAAGKRGAETLHGVFEHLANDGDIALWFNDTLGIFAAKGEEEQDHVDVTRAAVETLPLGLKNTDNKAIGGTINMVVKPMLSKTAIWLQRGFVAWRRLIQNVLDIDTAARILGDRGHEEFDVETRCVTPIAGQKLKK
jgi:hypothetical protein